MSNESIKLKSFSHAAIGVRNLNKQLEFFVNNIGLENISETPQRTYFRAVGSQHHVLELVEGHRGLHHIAFEVTNDEELDRAKRVLNQHGIRLIQEPIHGIEPGVGRLLRFKDPEGNVIELVSDVTNHSDSVAVNSKGPLSLDHVTLYAGNVKKQQRFYETVLGMRVRDTVPGLLSFLTCTSNHHSLGFIGLPKRGAHHIAFDYADRRGMMDAMIHLADCGFKKVDGPGRHGPGNSLYTYFEDPEKNLIELVSETERIDDPLHKPGIWSQPEAINLWRISGPMGPPPGLGWMVHVLPWISQFVRRK